MTSHYSIKNKNTLKTYEFIIDYFKEHSYAPSIREIQQALELNNTSVQFHVKKLRRLGLLSTDVVQPGSARAVRVVGSSFVLVSKDHHNLEQLISDLMKRLEGTTHWGLHAGEGITESIEMILRFIIGYLTDHGYPPTYEEIGNGVGLHSPSTVHHYVIWMLKVGMLETDTSGRIPRAIRVPGFRFIMLSENANP